MDKLTIYMWDKMKARKTNKKVKSKVMFWRGIRSKLIAAFLIPVVLIIILGFVSYQKASKSIINNYEKATTQTVEKTAEYLNLVFETIITNQIEIIMNPNVNNYLDQTYKGNPLKENEIYDAVNQYFLSKVMGAKFIQNIHLISANSKPFSTAGMLEQSVFENFLNEPIAEIFLEQNSESIFIKSHPYLDEKLGSENKNYGLSSIRCYNSKGKPTAYLFIDIKKEAIQDIMGSLEFGKESIKNIITKDGTPLLDTDNELIFSNEDFYQVALNSENISGSSYVTFEGKDYLFIYGKIKVAEELICVLISKADIMKEAEEIKNITVMIVIFACIIAVFIGAVLAQGFGNAISKIMKAVGLAAKGDLTGDIKLRRKDEFGVLSDSITDMMDQMKKLIGKIHMISNTVTEKASGVNHTSQTILNHTKDISISVGEIETGSSKQAEDTEECLQHMFSLADKILVVNDAAVKIEQYVSNTRDITVQGLSMMEELRKTSAQTTTITKEVISDIENMEEESKIIGNIVGIMNGIAEQSSLLSLNAHIEAARGKEGGNGFTVVAGEIGKLAGQSKNASKEISQIILKMQEQTKDTVKAAKRADEIIIQQEDTLKRSMDVFGNMKEHMNSLSIDLNKIMKEIQNIETSKNDTMEAIENITAISAETAACSKEVDSMTSNQLAEVERLHYFAGELLANATSMQEEVLRFTIDEKTEKK